MLGGVVARRVRHLPTTAPAEKKMSHARRSCATRHVEAEQPYDESDISLPPRPPQRKYCTHTEVTRPKMLGQSSRATSPTPHRHRARRNENAARTPKLRGPKCWSGVVARQVRHLTATAPAEKKMLHARRSYAVGEATRRRPKCGGGVVARRAQRRTATAQTKRRARRRGPRKQTAVRMLGRTRAISSRCAAALSSSANLDERPLCVCVCVCVCVFFFYPCEMSSNVFRAHRLENPKKFFPQTRTSRSQQKKNRDPRRWFAKKKKYTSAIRGA